MILEFSTFFISINMSSNKTELFGIKINRVFYKCTWIFFIVIGIVLNFVLTPEKITSKIVHTVNQQLDAEFQIKHSAKNKSVPSLHSEFFVDSIGVTANGSFFAITDGNSNIEITGKIYDLGKIVFEKKCLKLSWIVKC